MSPRRLYLLALRCGRVEGVHTSPGTQLDDVGPINTVDASKNVRGVRVGQNPAKVNRWTP